MPEPTPDMVRQHFLAEVERERRREALTNLIRVSEELGLYGKTDTKETA